MRRERESESDRDKRESPSVRKVAVKFAAGPRAASEAARRCRLGPA
ncbi:MAG: hypothetical protein OJF58_005458 [Enhydrobacter sp.]|nr:MAG: hypothetical protein OJF58_005458 [Enhydrobacter sp.]